MLYRYWLPMCCLLLLSSVSTRAQKAPAEPEYENVAAFLDPSAGALKPLERQTLATAAKPKVLGFGGATGSSTVQGEKSPVRFTFGQKLEFVVRVASQTVDPVSVIELHHFTVAKGARVIDTVRVNSVFKGGGVKESSAQSAVTFTAAKYGASSFKIGASQPLAAGEYVILVKSANTLTAPAAFCFGVDPQ